MCYDFKKNIKKESLVLTQISQSISIFLILVSSVTMAAETKTSEAKLKYGPEATPLSVSHEYFQKNSAPGFWALIPYYIPQQTGSSCSVATVNMLVNASRAGRKLKADDKLATETDLLKQVDLGA